MTLDLLIRLDTMLAALAPHDQPHLGGERLPSVIGADSPSLRFRLIILPSYRSEGIRPMPRILVVEDDAPLRLFIEHVLLYAGYEVDTAGTMSGGADLLRARRYDLVLSDVRLPDGNGLEIADLAGEKATKALMITGHAFTLSARAHERFEFLLKPVRAAEIITAVERALADHP
jgi:CheY-like chemotaxis protein